MMESGGCQVAEDIHGKAVGCVVLRGNQVLLVRHTYGSAKGKLLIPGGHVQQGEMPEDAARREVLEETGVVAEPQDILCLRFKPDDWYVVFRMRYVSGEPRTDGAENSQAIFLDIGEAVRQEDITEFSRVIIGSCTAPGLEQHSYCPEQSAPETYKVYGL